MPYEFDYADIALGALVEGGINPNGGPPIALRDVRAEKDADLSKALRRSRAETQQDFVLEAALDADAPPPAVVANGRIEEGVMGPTVPLRPDIVTNGRIEAGVVGPPVLVQPNGDPARLAEDYGASDSSGRNAGESLSRASAHGSMTHGSVTGNHFACPPLQATTV